MTAKKIMAYIFLVCSSVLTLAVLSLGLENLETSAIITGVAGISSILYKKEVISKVPLVGIFCVIVSFLLLGGFFIPFGLSTGLFSGELRVGLIGILLLYIGIFLLFVTVIRWTFRYVFS